MNKKQCAGCGHALSDHYETYDGRGGCVVSVQMEPKCYCKGFSVRWENKPNTMQSYDWPGPTEDQWSR